MTQPLPRHLFEALGIELEYMIVDQHSLDVCPIADVALVDEAGTVVSDVERGEIAWSNELARHVIEIKTNGPTPSLVGLADKFQRDICEINARLNAHGTCLMPSAMHPWMNPYTELELWPHEYSEVYQAFNRIFNCQGHGWANLQSMHINLPFAGDAEFGQLHASIRLILPILPAIAASSPVVEGKLTGQLDSRLEVYRMNSAKIPLVAGRVIPEPVYTQAAYDEEIFQPLYRSIAPHDPDGVLQEEFLNARGAIARFSRGAIEIRVLDVQECCQADVAIAEIVVAVLKTLVSQKWTTTPEQQTTNIDRLEPIFLSTIINADQAIICDARYLRQFGIVAESLSAGELWTHLLEQHANEMSPASLQVLKQITRQGCLARRITQALGEKPGQDQLHKIYQQLCTSLASGQIYNV